MSRWLFLTSLLLTSAAQAAPNFTYGGSAGLRYNDNLYRESQDETDDLAVILTPGFTLKHVLDENSLTIKGLIEHGEFLSEHDNDYNDADLSADFRHAFAKDHYLNLHSLLRYDHVDVGGFSTDFTDSTRRAKEPTTYRYAELGTTYQTPLGESFLGRTGITGVYYDYDNVDALNGGRIIQDDRDRYEVTVEGVLGYQMHPGLMPFAAVELNTRRYDNRVDASAVYERDSSGLGLFAGAEINKKDKDDAWANWQIGWLHQGYDNGYLPDVNTVGGNAEAGYRFNEALVLVATASRQVAENTFLGASSAVQSRIDTTLTYTLAPQWKLDGGVRYTQQDLQINPASRRPKRVDHIYEAGVGATYTLADPVYLRAEYDYADRTSDDSRADYTSNILLFTVGMTY
jgi:hypothetical protein